MFFFAELGLMQYTIVMYAHQWLLQLQCMRPDVLSGRPLSGTKPQAPYGFSKAQLPVCDEILVRSHSAAPKSNMKVVYKKQLSAQFGAVALCSPATKLLEHLRLNLHF